MNRTNSLFLNQTEIALGGFDFDGNILTPNTLCYVIELSTGNEVGIPAHKFDQHPELISGPNAQYRWKDDIEESMIHFRDFDTHWKHGGPDGLIKDVTDAIERNCFSPSFKAFKETFLIPARLFAIITARGHSADNLARAINHINDAVLNSDEKKQQLNNIHKLYSALYSTGGKLNDKQALQFYFQEIVSYYPVNNIHLQKSYGMSHIKKSADKKVFSMNHYIHDMRQRILKPLGHENMPLAIGFSDDSTSNMTAVLNHFMKQRALGNLGNDSVHLYFTGKQGSLIIPEGEKLNVTMEDTITTIVI